MTQAFRFSLTARRHPSYSVRVAQLTMTNHSLSNLQIKDGFFSAKGQCFRSLEELASNPRHYSTRGFKAVESMNVTEEVSWEELNRRKLSLCVPSQATLTMANMHVYFAHNDRDVLGLTTSAFKDLNLKFHWTCKPLHKDSSLYVQHEIDLTRVYLPAREITAKQELCKLQCPLS